MKNDQQIEQIRHKMKEIRKDILEANEIAKFMSKEVLVTEVYVSKFDDQGVYGGSSSGGIGEQNDEIQVKVENFDYGTCHIWTANKF